jgi:hypothetical protein
MLTKKIKLIGVAIDLGGGGGGACGPKGGPFRSQRHAFACIPV